MRDFGFSPGQTRISCGKPEPLRPFGDLLGLRARLRAQAMIDSGDMEGRRFRRALRPFAASSIRATESGPPETARRILRAPARGSKSCAIRSGGKAGGDPARARGAEERLRPGPPGPFGARAPPAPPLARRAQHWTRLASLSASALTPAAAFGYLRGSSAKVAQACSLAPSALSDWPSRSMASGARGEVENCVEILRYCSAASRGRLRW